MINGKKMVNPKRHIPVRTCVVCRAKVEKGSLTRLVISKNHDINVDKDQNGKGRGAYICDKLSCQQKNGLREQLSSSLKAEIAPESWRLFIEQLVKR